VDFPLINQGILRFSQTTLFGGMPIIEGEDIRAYCQLRDQIAARVKPKDILEETRREKARITCTYNTEYW
jgi:hypothetical protein